MNNTFSLLIKPASFECNLACRYCFYLQKSKYFPEENRMSYETLERMISAYMSIGMSVYQICWQGGEPTVMGLDFYKKSIEYIKKYGEGKQVSLALQTNGTLLTDEWAKFLKKYHFLVGISVDGPEYLHDLHRKNREGGGSHAEVMRGLNILRANGVEHNILTLMTTANIEKAEEIYKYNRDELKSNHHQYIECVEFDDDGNLRDYCVTGEQWGKFLCELFDAWYPDRYSVSVRLFDSILFRFVEQKANVCVMSPSCKQYLLIENNGDIFPCDFFMLPEHKLGNIHDVNGFMNAWTGQGMKDFAHRKKEYNEACNECEYLKFCHGCCQKNRSKNGVNPAALSNLCSGWKIFYKYTLDKFKELAKEVEERRKQEILQHQMEMMRNSDAGGFGKNAPCPCGSGKKFKRCCGK